MELSALSENIVTKTFSRGGEALELQINIDVVTPEYLEYIDSVFKEAHQKGLALLEPKAKKSKAEQRSDLLVEKDLTVLLREARASCLCNPVKLPDGTETSLLRGWDLVHHGEPVPCDQQNMIRLPPKAVEALFDFCLAAAKTVKKREDGEIEETSENMPSGSRELRVVGQTS